VEFATRPIQVIDLIPGATTNQNAVVYMNETTFTNNAAEVAEGGSYPEAALALTEVSSPVQKIAEFLPVTDEQMEDVMGIQAYVNNRLTFMLRQRLDGQILTGDGTSPNLSGILDRAGLQTQAKGADPTPDAIHKAITKCRVTGRATPNAVVLHSNDWQDIRLLRTADGIYIWGSPSETGPAMIWGLPVVLSEALTEGTGLVGDFATYAQLSIRRNVSVLVSNSHSDFFVKGKQAIRADMRASLEVFRDAAFCSVTGI
jgi:HK97 family phage major capsid protein